MISFAVKSGITSTNLEPDTKYTLNPYWGTTIFTDNVFCQYYFYFTISITKDTMVSNLRVYSAVPCIYLDIFFKNKVLKCNIMCMNYDGTYHNLLISVNVD